MKKREDPSIPYMQRRLAYQPDTGLFYWAFRPVEDFKDGSKAAIHQRNAWNARFAGKLAFTAITAGYLSGRIDGTFVFAHRAAWAMTNGRWPLMVDHINGVRTDNRIENLRECNAFQNSWNAPSPKGSSRFKGVSFGKRERRWLAHIRADGKRRHIGTFYSEEAAARAYDRAALKLHGEFARLNFPQSTAGTAP